MFLKWESLGRKREHGNSNGSCRVFTELAVSNTLLPKVGHPKCDGQDLSQTGLIPRLKSCSSVWASPWLWRS